MASVKRVSAKERLSSTEAAAAVVEAGVVVGAAAGSGAGGAVVLDIVSVCAVLGARVKEWGFCCCNEMFVLLKLC